MLKKIMMQINRRRQINNLKMASAGFGAGLLVGGGSALLLASQSGKKTREDIEENYKDKKSKVKKLYNETVKEVNKNKAKIIGVANSKFDEIADKALEKADEALKKSEEGPEKDEKKVEEKEKR